MLYTKKNNFIINIIIVMTKIFIFFLILIIIVCFYLTIKQENFSELGNKIPKIIIQTWVDKNPPEKYQKDIQSVKEKNPSYQYIFFDDYDIEKFLQKNYPDYYDTYKKLPIKIQKIDFFRYIAIYHYGGFYLDLDMVCLKCFDPLLKYDAVFPIDLILTDELCTWKYRNYDDYCKRGIRKFIGQYAFGAAPRNTFIKELIEGIHYNIDSIIQKHNENSNNNISHDDNIGFVYKTTGPDYVTDSYYNYPLKNDIHILEYPKEQYFGKYAKHNMLGTWK